MTHLMVPEYVKFRQLNTILIIYTTTYHLFFQEAHKTLVTQYKLWPSLISNVIMNSFCKTCHKQELTPLDLVVLSDIIRQAEAAELKSKI